jgi:hypothetical protein
LALSFSYLQVLQQHIISHHFSFQITDATCDLHGRSYQDANLDWRKNRRKKLAPKSAQGSQNTPAPILAYFLR